MLQLHGELSEFNLQTLIVGDVEQFVYAHCSFSAFTGCCWAHNHNGKHRCEMHGDLIREEENEFEGVEVLAGVGVAKQRAEDVITTNKNLTFLITFVTCWCSTYVLKTKIKNAIATVVNIWAVKYSSARLQASHRESWIFAICAIISDVFFCEMRYVLQIPHGRTILWRWIDSTFLRW